MAISFTPEFTSVCSMPFSSLYVDMDSAIKTVVTTFLGSARGEESLNNQSFQKLIQKNLSSIMEDTDSQSSIKEMKQGLDNNSDGKVSFQEYLNLIGYLANSLSQKKCEGNADSS
uniref:EF-hand domain-containing protein n=1 Tax=Oryzias latipes TaxID=8090 RepID=A0A3P9JHM6_ORYLA